MHAELLAFQDQPPIVPQASVDYDELDFRILVVDDQISERMRLVRLLEKLGYQVTACNDGEEALRLFVETGFNLVISDWRMPVMNGLDLCRAIRSDPGIGLPYFILLTARDTKMDLIAGMDAGADDFVTKPYSGDEIRVRVQAGERIMRLQENLKSRNQALEEAMLREQTFLDQTRTDLRAAAVMQRALLPEDQTWAHGWETASMFVPASGVAGDIFDCFMLDDKTLGFYHLDVAGHGIAAAMLSFTLSRFLSPKSGDASNLLYNSQLSGNQSAIAAPAEVISRLNERFQDLGMDARFFTIVYGYVDLTSHTGRLCQAGHPHPLQLAINGQVQKLGQGGLPVGVFPNAEFSDHEFYLEPGSSLILHSDGAPECLNQGREPFGSEKLCRTIANCKTNSAKSIIEVLAQELEVWLGEEEMQDDISGLVITSPKGGIQDE